MLKIGRMGGKGRRAEDAAEYYLSYASEHSRPGRWIGRGLEDVHIEAGSEVDGDTLVALFLGRSPEGETLLTRPEGGRIGYDVQLSTPKSVSILWAISEDETVRSEVEAAQAAAVEQAMRFIEEEVLASRAGRAGAEHIEVSGLLAAAFEHRSSREGDPHIHTHCLVANLVKGEDGKWRTIDSSELYHWAKTSGFLYEAALRKQLTERLGVQWTKPEKGFSEIVGLEDPKLIAAFSKRRRQVLEAVGAGGTGTSIEQREAAALSTRKAKADTEHLASPDLWRATAAELGLGQEKLSACLHRDFRLELKKEDLLARLLGPSGLTQSVAHFGRREVLQGVTEGHQAGLSIEDAQRFADEVLAHEEVVSLRGDADIEGCRPALWTTKELLQAEKKVVFGAIERKDEEAAVVPNEVIEAAIAGRPSLSEEQAEMVRHVCGPGGVSVVVGLAGVGKSFSLGVAHEAWTAAGHRVIGCSNAATAAQELQASAGIESTTVAQLLIDLMNHQLALGAGDVVVVDEAGTVGTRNLAKLSVWVSRAGAKLVLVGDHRQLAAVEAGGVFETLVKRVDSARLSENRRQEEQWEHTALARLRDGDTSVVTELADHGRITIDEDLDASLAHLAEDFLAALGTGEDALIYAPRRWQVDLLNHSIQNRLVASGTLTAASMTVIHAGEEQSFYVGDQVMGLQNPTGEWRKFKAVLQGWKNGTRGVVAGRRSDGSLLVTSVDGSQTWAIPPEYVQAGHVTLGYARTVHKTQGATVDRGFVLAGDAMYNEMAYVALSRARRGTQLYLAADPDDEHDDEHHGLGEEAEIGEPIERLMSAWSRGGGQSSAMEVQVPFERRVAIEAARPMNELAEELEALKAPKPRLPAGLANRERRAAARLAAARRELERRTSGIASPGGGSPPGERSPIAEEARRQLEEAEVEVARSAEERRVQTEALRAWEEVRNPDRVRLLIAAMRRREAILGRAAEAVGSHPLLGDVPSAWRDRRTWRRAAGAIAAWEESHTQPYELGADERLDSVLLRFRADEGFGEEIAAGR